MSLPHPLLLPHKGHWQIENGSAFKLGCWKRFWRVPWTERRSNQTILKEINPEHSWEGLMLRLKLQYFGHLIRRTNLLEKTWCQDRLKVGGEGEDRGWDGWMASLTQWTWVWASSGRWWRTGKAGALQSTGSQRVEWLSKNGRAVYLPSPTRQEASRGQVSSITARGPPWFQE